MCIIVAMQEREYINDETFKNCWSSNPDGGGIAYVDDSNSIKVFKSMKLKPLLNKYKEVKEVHDTPILLHFRIATHGSKNSNNNHPFWVNHSLVMAHNGIINKVTIPKGSDRTDSEQYVYSFLRQLPEGFHQNYSIKEMMGYHIGASKLAFLDKNKNIEIVNEDLGQREGSIWFSNSTYKALNSYNYYGRGGGTLNWYQNEKYDWWDYENQTYKINSKTEQDMEKEEKECLDMFPCDCCNEVVPALELDHWDGHDICCDCLEVLTLQELGTPDTVHELKTWHERGYLFK